MAPDLLAEPVLQGSMVRFRDFEIDAKTHQQISLLHQKSFPIRFQLLVAHFDFYFHFLIDIILPIITLKSNIERKIGVFVFPRFV